MTNVKWRMLNESPNDQQITNDQAIIDWSLGIGALLVIGAWSLVILAVRCAAVIIGILSDTHDRLESTIAGLDKLRAAGAEFFIHCGDVGGERILDQFAGIPAALVWGNNDWDRRELTRYAQNRGIQVSESLVELELGSKKFAVTHGDDAGIVRRIIDGQAHDYLLLGHSHVRADQRMGKIRIINPGALHRAARKSVVLLDTVTDELQFLGVP